MLHALIVIAVNGVMLSGYLWLASRAIRAGEMQTATIFLVGAIVLVWSAILLNVVLD